MYVTVLFKRPSSQGAFTDYYFDLREFICFNGFNTANAFSAPVGAGGSIMVTVPNSTARGYLPVPSQVTVTQDSQTLTGWSCLGIGWISPYVPTWEGFNNPNAGARTLHTNRVIASLLCREAISDTVSPWTGNIVRTKRALTPNELEIKNLMKVFSITNSWNTRNSSVVLRALVMNHCYNHTLLDFVGSERSSGMAVSYLQVFRNVSQVIACPTRSPYNSSPAENFLQELLCDYDGAMKVGYPGVYLSGMFNHGDDSDILSYSNHMVALQGIRYGMFSLEPFFRRTESMLVEGRYLKGGQSHTLASNVATAAAQRNQTVTQQVRDTMALLHRAHSIFHSAEQVLSANRMVQYSDANQWFTQNRNKLEDLYLLKVVRILPVLQSVIRDPVSEGGFKDLREPVDPQRNNNVAQAAQGYMAWSESVIH